MRIRKLLSLGLASTMLASLALTGCGDKAADEKGSLSSKHFLDRKSTRLNSSH